MEYDERMEIVERRSYHVVKANEIIQQARYDLTLKELKLLGYLISLVKPNDAEDKKYTMTIKEYCNIRGIDGSGKNYISIKKTIKSLRDKSFWIQNEEGTETLVGWLGGANLIKRTGKINLWFDAELQKYIVGLRGNYTQYELLATLPMKSAYSIRLYELLKSYSYNHDNVQIDIEELKERTGSKDMYSDFRNFRRRVLDMAVREINLYTDLEVSYSTIKSIKTITAILFYLKKKNLDGRIAAYDAAERELDGDTIKGQITVQEYLDSMNGDLQSDKPVNELEAGAEAFVQELHGTP